jgi:hypothetical protein
MHYLSAAARKRYVNLSHCQRQIYIRTCLTIFQSLSEEHIEQARQVQVEQISIALSNNYTSDTTFENGIEGDWLVEADVVNGESHSIVHSH